MKKIGINAVLNAIRQGLAIIFPLITYPYALRVLGVTNIGKVNYGSSIISYFALIACLGISTYAIREGSKKRENKDEISNFASQMFSINLISTIVTYILFILFILNIESLGKYRILLVIQSLSILFTTISIDWVNNIFEDYFSITIRSILTYCISLILLFACVHSSEDYLIYASIQIFAGAVVSITNWFYCRRYVKIRFTLQIDLKNHIKPIMILFANSLAISIYVSFDTTMIGWWKGDAAVGYYSAAVKIYTIVKSLMMAIYAVTIPRLSYLFGIGDMDGYKKLFSSLWGILTILLIPVSVGLYVLSPQIMEFIGGSEYIQSSGALRILCFALIFSIYAGFVSPVLNVTIGREKDNLWATLLSASVNFGLNFYFIDKFSFVGAAFTTMIAEFIAFAFPLLRIKNMNKYLYTKSVLKSLVKVIISSFVIVALYFFIINFEQNVLLVIIFTIISSIALYVVLLYLLRDEYFIELFNIVKKKVLK